MGVAWFAVLQSAVVDYNSAQPFLVAAVAMPAIGSGVAGRLNNTAKLGTPDFDRQRAKVIAQLLAETAQVAEELLPIGLEQVPDFLALFGRRRMPEADQQQALLAQILVALLIEIQDEVLDRVWHAAQILHQVPISAVLRHYLDRRGACPKRARASEAYQDRPNCYQDSNCLHLSALSSLYWILRRRIRL